MVGDVVSWGLERLAPPYFVNSRYYARQLTVRFVPPDARGAIDEHADLVAGGEATRRAIADKAAELGVAA